MKHLFSILLLFSTAIFTPQEKDSPALLEEAVQTLTLLATDAETAFAEAKTIESKAKK